MNDADVAFDYVAPQVVIADETAVATATAATAHTDDAAVVVSVAADGSVGAAGLAVAGDGSDDAVVHHVSGSNVVVSSEGAAAAHHGAEGGAPTSSSPSSSLLVHSKGRMSDLDAQIFSETTRRLSRSRGGVFEMLSLLPGQQPGEPAKSLEGWVLIITGLPAECTEGDLLDYFGRRAELKNCRMNHDRRAGGGCVGHAFVEYHSREEAELVIEDMNNKPFLSSDSISVSPAFLVPELAAFEQLGRTTKRGRARDDRLGAEEVEGDNAPAAAADGAERGGNRVE